MRRQRVGPMGRSQQRKGRGGEIEICKILNANGISAQPGQAVSFGSVPDVTGIDGIHAEVKRCQQLRLSEWMEQATRDAAKFGDGLPAIFHRRNRSPWLVTMQLSDWLALFIRAKEGEIGRQEGDDTD